MKKVIVTGATGGIGLSISKLLTQKGFFVLGTTVSSKKEQVDSWNDVTSTRGKLFQLDITNHDSCTNFTQHILEEHEDLYALVNNAGIVMDSLFKNMTLEQWEKVLYTNLVSVFNITQPVFKHLCEKGGGRIINISSVNAEKGQKGQVNYCASKAGLKGFTKALSLEGARYNVACNTISPGYTSTNMVNEMREDIKEAVLRTIPLGRFADTDEIAGVVGYLLEENASYITGSDIHINGGLYLD